jgi:transcription antitermination factor NusA-like protein
LKKDAISKLLSKVECAEYSDFMKKLIIQGLIKIEENSVEIRVRNEDKLIVSKIVSNNNNKNEY